MSDKPGSGLLVSRDSSGGSRLRSLLDGLAQPRSSADWASSSACWSSTACSRAAARSGLRVLAGSDGSLDRLDGGGDIDTGLLGGGLRVRDRLSGGGTGGCLGLADHDQVDVLEHLADDVALDVARGADVVGAVDVEREHDAGLAQGLGQVVAVEGHVDRVGAVAVDHGGHLAGAAQAAGRALAEVAARDGGHVNLGVGHDTNSSRSWGDGPSAGGSTRHHVDHGSAVRSQERRTQRGTLAEEWPRVYRRPDSRTKRSSGALRHPVGAGAQCPGSPFGVGSNMPGHRAVGEDLLDGRGQQRGDRQDGELVEASAVIGSVSVTTTSEMGDSASRSRGRVGQDAVRGGDDDVAGALLEQGLGRLHDRAAGVDHVVDDDADAVLDVTDHLEHLAPGWARPGRDACG